MNKYETYVSKIKPAKIKPWGRDAIGAYLIPYEYGHTSTGGIPTDGGRVWWVSAIAPTDRADNDQNTEPFTIKDLDI